jgi:hypothetical protein
MKTTSPPQPRLILQSTITSLQCISAQPRRDRLKRIRRWEPETAVSRAATRVTFSGGLLRLRTGSYQYDSSPVPPFIPIHYPSSSWLSNELCCNKDTLAVHIIDRRSAMSSQARDRDRALTMDNLHIYNV